MLDKTVRSIDLGYGRVKFVKAVALDGNPITDAFPSIVARAQRSLGDGYSMERNTIPVEYGGVAYEVGQDVLLATGAYSTRTTDMGFIKSDPYHVLMMGCLKKMALEQIHLLVLGAPVLNYGEVKSYLQGRYTGQVDIGGGRRVNIERVMVLPQPLGGLVRYGQLNGVYERMRDEVTLTIDPGFFTLDWMVSKGLSLVPGRSGSHPGGMAGIIRALAHEIAKAAGESNIENLFNMDKIDKALYSGARFTIYGKELDLKQYAGVAQRVVAEGLEALTASVGDASGVDNIILLGGAAHAYLSVLRRKFVKHEILLLDNPVFANVLGFQAAGEEVTGIRKVG